MKKIGNKGQGAMEYLMTYGWAILVVMIVGVVLWQLGVFGGGPGTATATDFSKIKPLNPGEIQLTANKNISAIFLNGAGNTITLTAANITFTAPSGATCGPAAYAKLAGTTGVIPNLNVVGNTLSVGQGDTFDLTIDGCTNLGTTGGRYSSEICMVYDIEVGGFTRTRIECGKVSGPIA